jgi:aspartyl-tRNA(Asn)/glutamyl-tRNA(Gln) amidotransferase subunit B
MDNRIFDEWEPVIGLEVHVELNTRSKLFSGAPNRFGDEPNTNISVVCTGQPGALPVLNQEAVKKAVLLGTALKAHVAPYSRFDRKSYFYPDSPRNFQITQYEMPIIIGGEVTTELKGEIKTYPIDRAHLEDDAGMLKHYTTFAGVDYNRAGVPLIEIVSKPCLFSSDDAVAYATALKAILQYLDVSDCNMEEGSLRMDANISVRRKGETTLRNKIEIKNMNSFSFMQMALDAEFKRQVKAYLSRPQDDPQTIIKQATYRWDPEKKETILMRTKESADDYRYFLEPDLPPIVLEQAYIDQVKSQLPELPYARLKRYMDNLGLAKDVAALLVNDKHLSDYFEAALSYYDQNAKALSNWIVVEFAGRYKEQGRHIWQSDLPAAFVGQLVRLIDTGQITGKMAKQVADLMIQNPSESPEKIVAENTDFQPMQDESALLTIVETILRENSASVTDYKNGKQRAFGFLVGQVMKATGGKASPEKVNALLKKHLEGSKQLK